MSEKIEQDELNQDVIIDDLKNVVNNMSDKRRKTYLEWVKNQTRYLVWETTFEPSKLLKYKRGDLLYVNFGFNVSAEFGGVHWAVVVDKNNSKAADTVVVVPLSSLDDGKTEEDVHSDDVYIGVIKDINDKEVFAVTNQIRAISKLRIIKPKNKYQKRIKLDNDILDKIDEKVKKLYTK